MNKYTSDLDKALQEGTSKEDALATIFKIGGNRRIRIGGSYYTPKNVTIDGDVVTVTKTGKPKQETVSGEDLDKISYDLSDPTKLYNFLRATTALKELDIEKLSKKIIAYKTN
jgi:hypothetical protein